MTDLPPTGERFHPTMRGTIRYEHLHRYALCLPIVAGLDVLDVASGEGYGSMLLGSRAKAVVGVDVEPRAVAHARRTYYRPNVRFLVGDCTEIPVADASFDAVISFETIEHVEDHDRMLAEVRRVLRPGGRLVISSPNKLVYSDDVNFKNPYHVRELYYDEFLRLLQRHFPHVRMHGQRLAAASFVFPLVDRAPGPLPSFVANGAEPSEGLAPLERPMYFIAVCGEDEVALEGIDSLFLDAHDDVLQTLQAEHEQALSQLATHQHALASGRGVLEVLPGDPARPLHLAAHAGGDAGESRLPAEYDVLRRELTEARSERDAMARLRDAERAELDAVRAEFHALIAAPHEVNSAPGSLLEAMRAERDIAIGERDAQLLELRHLRAERDAWIAERDEAAREADALARQRAEASAQAEELLRERVAANEAEREALRSEVDALRYERDRRLAERDEALADAEAQRAALAVAGETALAAAGETAVALESVAAERDAAAAARDIAQSELDAAVTSHRELASRYDALVVEREQLLEAQRGVARIERERVEIRAELARNQRRSEALVREVDGLRGRLDAANAEIGVLREGRASLGGAARRLHDLCAAYETRIAALVAATASCAAQIVALERAHAEYAERSERDVRALRDVLSSRSWKLTAPLRSFRGIGRHDAGNG